MRLDDSERYATILAKDDRFDGLFFSGIATTGVYCRPVCPVPRPAKRENIQFFPSSPAAAAAGFRPCRRCRPERAAPAGVWSGVPPVVSHALNLIADGVLDGEGNVDLLAGRVGIGARQLRRLFETHLGASPVAIARARRVNFARRLLDDSDLPAAGIALAAGYRSVRQFNHDIRQTFGRPPSELRRKTPGIGVVADEVTIQLAYRPPLDWMRAVAFLRARATRGVEVVEHDRYRRTVRLGDVPAVIELRLVPDAAYLLLIVRGAGEARLVDVAERAGRIFDLAADPVTIAADLGQNADMRQLIRRRPGIRVPGAWDGFELAVRAILGQQISVRAANTLAARLVTVFGEPCDAGDGLTHLFPAAATLANADVRQIGTTRSQAGAIRALATVVAAGELAISAPRGRDEFVERMCALPGIGTWTAQYVAMRACREPDAFPAGDLGLRRAAGNGSPLSARQLAVRSEHWRPWRAYAAMYLWSSLATERDGQTPADRPTGNLTGRDQAGTAEPTGPTRRGGVGRPSTAVAYATIPSPLGPLLAAATDAGLVTLRYDRGNRDELIDELRSRLGKPREKPRSLDQLSRQLDRYFEGQLRTFDLRIDWRLAPGGFMRRALEATSRIPFGELRTYRELAAAAGNPRASRAAGTALGRNPIAIVIPCHRVLRSGRTIGNYDAGQASSEHKEYLLKLEHAWPPTADPET